MIESIERAYREANNCRPFVMDEEIIKKLIPPGGNWQCVAGAICRSVVWNGTEVAFVNPRGDIDDNREGQIAMAIRALPVMDAALRAIMVLAKSEANLATISKLAESVLAHVEMPAPEIETPEE